MSTLELRADDAHFTTPMSSLLASLEGGRLATGYTDGTVRIWNVEAELAAMLSDRVDAEDERDTDTDADLRTFDLAIRGRRPALPPNAP